MRYEVFGLLFGGANHWAREEPLGAKSHIGAAGRSSFLNPERQSSKVSDSNVYRHCAIFTFYEHDNRP
jgi:hypothetical protein